MKHLLSLSTHGDHLDLIGDDWSTTAQLLTECGRDGYELYRVAPYPWEKIPPQQIVGLHLRFLAFLDAIWRGDRESLLTIFGDLETAEHYFGGLERRALVDLHREELLQAQQLQVEYAVFHASQVNFDGLVDWRFPWTFEDTIEMVVELIGTILDEVEIDFPILFENLWWPGGLQLKSSDEIDRLLERFEPGKVGIVLDTAHIFNMNQNLRDEDEAIDYLLDTVTRLGDRRQAIRAVHLTRSLSGEYVRWSRAQKDLLPEKGSFWDRFVAAHAHVKKIDQHEPFDSPRIAELFQLLDPSWLIDEFYFTDAQMCRSFSQRHDQALTALHQE